MNNSMYQGLAQLEKQWRTLFGSSVAADPYRLKFHIMPPVGWLNDPNGLCWFRGEYHIYFQYAPFDAKGGIKLWGHVCAPDLVNWRRCDPILYPDQPYDIHGVYSGSALVEDDQIYFYYTGNVRHSGEYDYVYEGRGHNLCLATSKDGMTMQTKSLLMENDAYPENLSCHVRDPKVWKQGDTYFMVLGARTMQDRGEVLIFTSRDRLHWKHQDTFTTQEPFGYMWECPDLFELQGMQILSVSPQGLTQRGDRYQNTYACGYFPNAQHCDGAAFVEWDKGFDFYACQTFLAPDGRRIMVGWMGMPDAEYCNPTVEQGWQHCLSVPCELTVREGRVMRNPVREITSLHGAERDCVVEDGLCMEDCDCFDLVWTMEQGAELACVVIRGCLVVEWKHGKLSIDFLKNGGGRTRRYAEMEALHELRILADTSSLEIFVNGGETVFSTRYYPEREQRSLHFVTGTGKLKIWEMHGSGAKE